LPKPVRMAGFFAFGNLTELFCLFSSALSTRA